MILLKLNYAFLLLLLLQGTVTRYRESLIMLSYSDVLCICLSRCTKCSQSWYKLLLLHEFIWMNWFTNQNLMQRINSPTHDITKAKLCFSITAVVTRNHHRHTILLKLNYAFLSLLLLQGTVTRYRESLIMLFYYCCCYKEPSHDIVKA